MVRYDQKPNKDGQRCDICNTMIRRNELFLTVRLNQPASGTIDCIIHVPKICQTFFLKSQYSVYLQTLKHILKDTVKRHANNSGNHVVPYSYLQGHPVYRLDSNDSFLLQF